MVSVRAILAACALASTTSASLYGESNQNHTCALQPDVLSCSADAVPGKVDTCCTETFGGLLLQTQFWTIYTGREAQGQLLPPNTWTVHGLWPDFCNGSYTQYCDLNRQYDPIPSPNTTTGKPGGTPVPAYNGSNIGTFLEPFGRYDLLNWMNTYWIAQNQDNPGFWGHEFSKHATCFSTFDVPCYGPNYQQHQEVVEFFETAIKYYQRLPTWDWLAKYNIRPSNTTTYSLSDFEGSLTKEYGQVPYVGCSGPRYNETDAGKAANSTDGGRTSISEVWYYFHAYGRPQDLNAVPIAQTTTSNCAKAKGALHYYEPTKGSVRTGSSPAAGFKKNAGNGAGPGVCSVSSLTGGATTYGNGTASSSASPSTSTGAPSQQSGVVRNAAASSPINVAAGLALAALVTFVTL